MVKINQQNNEVKVASEFSSVHNQEFKNFKYLKNLSFVEINVQINSESDVQKLIKNLEKIKFEKTPLG